MRTILITILIFAVIIFIHECGHFFAAKLCGVRVNEFALGMGPTLFHFDKGGTRYALRLFPIGGFVSMEGEDGGSGDPRAFCNQKVWKRIVIVCAGAFMNLVLGFLVVVAMTAPSDRLPTLTVAQFYENASTAATGLREGDTILAVNGRPVWVDSDLVYSLSADEDGVVDLTVRRDGEKTELRDVAFAVADGTLTVDFTVVGEDATLFSVLGYSFRKSASIARLVWLAIGQLITGQASVNDLTGPIGTAQAIGEAASAGLSTTLALTAFIAINVGIFNILPVPALDGGRLIFLLFELVTRRRVKPEHEAYVHFAGFVLLMLLILFVTYHDIVNLLNG